MIGAIAGDIIGSVFEGGASSSENFDLFNVYANITDDTVCTVAISDWLKDIQQNNPGKEEVDYYLRKWVKAYPGRGYGGRFYDWAHNLRINPPNSLANGAVMRVSPVGYFLNTLDDCLEFAEKSCIPTHNHPEAVEAAKFIAGAIFLYRTGLSPDEIMQWVQGNSNYEFFDNVHDFLNLSDSYNQKARETAIVALNISFLANSFEDGMRKLCVLGGDTDTTCATAGGLLEARFGVPVWIAKQTKEFLTQDMIEVLESQYLLKGEEIPWNQVEEPNISTEQMLACPQDTSFIMKITRFFNKFK